MLVVAVVAVVVGTRVVPIVVGGSWSVLSSEKTGLECVHSPCANVHCVATNPATNAVLVSVAHPSDLSEGVLTLRDCDA